MPTRDELIEAAQKKYQREQLIAQAQSKWESENAPQDDQDIAGTAETAARGLFSGVTAGLSEPVISGANAGIQSLLDAVRERDLGELSPSKIGEEYSSDVARRRSLQEQHPIADVGGEIAGAFSPVGPAAAIAGAGSKIKALANIAALGSKAPKVLQGASKIAVPILEGALGAGGATLAEEGAKQAVKRVSGFQTADEAPNLIDAATGSAAFGGKLGAGIQAVKGVQALGGKIGMGAISAISGNVSPERMKAYLDYKRAGGEDIPLEAAKGRIDDAIEMVRQKGEGMAQDYSDAVVNSTKALKDRVVQGSSEAWDILAKTNPNLSIPTASVKNAVTTAIKNVQGPGGMIGPTTKEAVGQLEALRGDLENLPKDLDLVTSKDVLNKIRESIDFNSRAGTFGSAGTNAFKSVQGVLDGMIKARSPEYAAKMEDVARDTKLLAQASEMYGDAGQVYKKIPSLTAVKDPVQRQVLESLGSRVGTDLAAPLGEIQQRRVIAAMRPGQTEGFLKTIIGDRSIENRKKLQLLSQLSDQDLVKMADNAAISSTFDKEFRAGSQHVNFWTVIGGLTAGGVLGDSGLGMGGGAVLGVLTTKFGPRATKMLLDQVAQMQGTPTAQKISKMSIPEDMRRYLKMSLVRSVDTFKDYAPIEVPEYQREAVAQDIQNSKALTVQDKATALSALNAGDGIAPGIMRRMAVEESKPKTRFIKEGDLPKAGE
jgi:hypothetical protein